MRISTASLEQVTKEALSGLGAPESHIRAVTEAFLYANRAGIPTHGIRHLPMFVDKILAGCMDPSAQPETVIDSESVTVIDAHNTFGEAAGKYAVDIGTAKAKEYGSSVVGVRNSNSFGAAGHYGCRAAERNLAAFICANAAPAIAPTGGYKTIFGTNPLCLAFPGGNENRPVVLDMATTVAARSKIRLAAKNGGKIPIGWAVGPDGLPTDDPERALQGSLLPIAGYKGYGLSLFIDLFAGLLTASAFAGAVKPLTDTGAYSRTGHFFIFIDTERFMDAGLLRETVDAFCGAVRDCGDEGAVMLPGEPGYKSMDQNTDSVVITEKEYDEVNLMAEKLGIEARLREVAAD